MTIGEKIKRLRKEQNMTQEDLGAAVGVQKAAINKYETGIVVNLKRKVIEKLADALGVNPVWLMDDNADWPPVESTQRILEKGFQEYYEKNGYPDTGYPKTPEARIISGGIDKMPKERREQALKILQIAFAEFADLFEEEETNDDT